ncbi:MAG TPA: hypothetical protein VGL06_19170 [Pseudonocardiaceae bacterium]|jgi:hypothetical protein
MGERRQQKLISAATRLMAPGEQVELTTLAKLGSAPVVATAVAGIAAGVVAGLLGGGVGFVGFRRREVYIVLTDRQVLFFEAVRATGGPGKHLASFRREVVTSTPPRGSALGLIVKVTVTVEGMSRPVELNFPPLPPALRAQARQLAAALSK